MTPDVRDFAIREIGCIVARIRGEGFEGCEKHHLLTTGRHGNGKRRGERFTIGLSQYRHRGILIPGMAVHEMYERYGPSYYWHARQFRALYPDSMLLETQNEWLEKWKKGEIS